MCAGEVNAGRVAVFVCLLVGLMGSTACGNAGGGARSEPLMAGRFDASRDADDIAVFGSIDPGNRPGTRPLLCAGVMESAPPQCADPPDSLPLANATPDQLDRWWRLGRVVVTGDLREGVLHVREVRPSEEI